jgi:hypothetical protein
MKVQNLYHKAMNRIACFIVMLMFTAPAFSQTTDSTKTDNTATEEPETVTRKAKPVKSTFESVWIIDNQTVMVPVKNTFEMDIMHRFGTVDKGYEDFWGFFAPSNIRLGFSYTPINKLNLGLGITKSNMIWDASAKYSIISQTKGIYPVSVTYYGNMSYDTRKDADKSIFKYSSDRFMFFHQLIVGRKINDKLSLQVAPSVSHQNFVYGYYKQVDSATRAVSGEMEHNHFAIAFSGRYKISTVTSILVNVDQPITKHTTNNPNPNISFGFEFSTVPVFPG